MATVVEEQVSSTPVSLPARSPLASLISMIRLGTGNFTLIKVNYDHPSQREVIIARLREALPEKNLVTVSLQNLDPKLPKSAVELCDGLEELARRNADGKAVDVVLLVDWEQRLLQDRPPEQQPSDTLAELFNFGRETLKERFHCPFIVFLPRWAANIVDWLIPDLMSGRSGGFYFSTEHIPVVPPKPVESITAEWWEVFRGAAALTPEDQIVGRERDLEKFLGMVLAPNFRCGTLWGETGCGKTSFVQAGLLPELKRTGYFVVYLNEYRNPIAALRSALTGVFPDISESTGSLYETLASVPRTGAKQITFLLFDQFERAYAETVLSPEDRYTFLNDLARCINDNRLPIRCIFLPRADYLHHLLGDFDRLTPLNHPLTVNYRYELPWLSQADAERVLDVLGRRAGKHWQQELIQEAIKNLSRNNQVKPVEIQLIGAALFLLRIKSIEDYNRAGGKNGLLKNYLNAIFADVSNPMLARRIVRALVLASDPPLRTFPKPARQIADELRISSPKVEALLRELGKRHIVSLRKNGSEVAYELIHDVLIESALRAATPQEIGQAVIYSALHKRRWFLWLPSYWRARRADLQELASDQQKKARWLLRSSKLVLAAQAVLGVLAAITAVQFSFIHVDIDDSIPTQPIKFYRGLPALSFLPGPLGAVPLFDTGISFQSDISANSRSIVEGLIINRWADPTSQVKLLIPYFNTETKAKWKCYLGDWREGLRLLLSSEFKGHSYTFHFLYPSKSILVFALPEVDIEMGIQALIEFSENYKDSETRVATFNALGQLSIPTKQAVLVVKTLLTAAQEQDFNARSAATDTLGKVPIPTEQVESVVKTLLTAAQDQNWYDSSAAINALGKVPIPVGQVGSVVKTLLTAAQDRDRTTARSAAIDTLGKVPIPTEQVESVVKTLLIAAQNSQDSSVQTAALGTLRKLPIPAKQVGSVMKTLLIAAQKQDFDVRSAALDTLRELPIPTKQMGSMVKTLLTAIQNEDQDPDVLPTVIGVLGRLPISAEQAWPVAYTLLTITLNQNSNVQSAAIHALRELSIPKERLRLIIKVLLTTARKRPKVRLFVAYALPKLAIPAEQMGPVVKTLLTAAQDQDVKVKSAAIDSLGELSLPVEQVGPVVKTLLTAVQDQDEQVKSAAIKALGQLPLSVEQVGPVVKTLLTVAQDQAQVPRVRFYAAKALGQLPIPAEQGESVVKTLLTAVQDQDEQVKSAAIKALGRLSLPAEQVALVVNTLLTTAQDQDGQVKYATIEVLGRLPLPAEQVAPVVKTLLTAAQDRDGQVEHAAIEVLGRLPIPVEQVESVVKILLAAAYDQYSYDRPAFLEALERVPIPAEQIVLITLTLSFQQNAPQLRTIVDDLGQVWLASAQKDQNSTVYPSLLQRLRTEDKSRLDAAYRSILISALAYWYNAGQDNSGNNNPFAKDPRARQEHAELQKELENLRDTGPLWLRAAAAEVWMTAYELRGER